MCTIESSVIRSARVIGSTDGSSISRRKIARSLICIAAHSAMFFPLIRDERAASFSRVPPHDGQAVNVATRSTAARIVGCIESTSFRR